MPRRDRIELVVAYASREQQRRTAAGFNHGDADRRDPGAGTVYL
jgi:hypothetical protein